MRGQPRIPQHSQARAAATAWTFLGCGLAVVAVFALGPPALGMPVLVLVPVASIGAIVVGLVRNQVRGGRRPWYAFAATLACFLGGEILRLTVPSVAATPPGPAAFIPDALVVPGYLFFGYGLIDIVRRRQAIRDRPAGIDAILIGLTAGFTMWAFLLAPRIGTATMDTSVSQFVAAAFPSVDVILLVVVSRLMLAEGIRKPALWLVAAMAGVLFTADLVYALREAGLGGVEPPLMLFDVLFLVGNLTLAAAALHPTMRTLSEPQRVVCRTFGITRIAGVSAVVVAPTIMGYVLPASALWNVVVRVALTGVLAVLLVARIVRAHDSQARAEATARHRLTHDALTGLPNREVLTETIRQRCHDAVDGDQEISLLFLDLDRFKQVNDSWGHRVGDELLCAVAARLRSVVRAEDLVCRVGGDEFVVVLAGPPCSTLAELLAQRLVEEFTQPISLSVGDIVVTVSAGVARSTGAVEALELIRDADIAMYQAKGSGRNTYELFDTSLREKLHTRATLEQALRGALGRGELSVQYQPIVNLENDDLAGFEALMRWNHPQKGMVAPLDFIPIAEETGLIVSSGAWLLEEALDQLARWQRDRPAGWPQLHISVNISVRQLRDPTLVNVIRRVLSRTRLPASALWLEITESVLLKDPEATQATFNELRDLGVILCIDDFGTGYASLSYVRQLPAAIVKIDKSFVDGIGKHYGDEAIVRAVIAMAHELDQQVVAEGVEESDQRDWLKKFGCDLVQGWLYGRAQPPEEQFAWRDRSLQPTRQDRPARV